MKKNNPKLVEFDDHFNGIYFRDKIVCPTILSCIEIDSATNEFITIDKNVDSQTKIFGGTKQKLFQEMTSGWIFFIGVYFHR
jgi:hypothetical protein